MNNPLFPVRLFYIETINLSLCIDNNEELNSRQSGDYHLQQVIRGFDIKLQASGNKHQPVDITSTQPKLFRFLSLLVRRIQKSETIKWKYGSKTGHALFSTMDSPDKSTTRNKPLQTLKHGESWLVVGQNTTMEQGTYYTRESVE